MKFTIPTRLAGLNEYIAAINRNKYIGNKLKQDTEDTICLYISRAVSIGALSQITEYPVAVNFEWHEKTRRRDLDNIVSAKKFILDALQKSKILKGDGQKYVADLNDVFCIPSEYDGVIVEIIGMKRRTNGK